jgi:hypothetical protein
MSIDRCRCARLEDAEEAVPTRERFVEGMTLVEEDTALWSQLLVCSVCGTRWRIEVNAEIDRRANVAFKVPPDTDWRKFDERPGRRSLTIRKAGGLSTKTCHCAGCANRALLGMWICADHWLGFAEKPR